MLDVGMLLVALLLVAACGFFVAAEFALITVNRAELENDAAAGHRGAARILSSLRSLSTQLSGAQLGITVTNLAIGFLAQPAIASLLQGPLTAAGIGGAAGTVSVIIALVLATAVTMIFGELVPKNLAIARPLPTARVVTGFLRGFSRATAHLIRVCNGTANKILRVIGIEPQEELGSARSAAELSSLVNHSAVTGTLAVETAEWVQRSLAFGDRRAHQVMTPRSRMQVLTADATVQDLIKQAKTTGHSRFPVLAAGNSESGVVGTAHVRRALSVPFTQRAHTPLSQLMVPPTLLPDTIELDELLDTLRSGGHHMAVLIDEFGDVAGMVTLEDLVEEIVGEVRDEHDTFPEPARSEPDGSFLVSGLLRPDEVTDLTGIQIPESEEYDTVGGLLVDRLNRLPRTGDTVTITADPPGAAPAEVTLTVHSMDGLRVDHLRITAIPSATEPALATGGRANMNEIWPLALTVLLLALNGFFVAAEFALISARRSMIEPKAAAGSRSAATTLKAMENVSVMMAGCQLGITICSLALGMLSEPAIAGLLEGPFAAVGIPEALVHPTAFAIALAIITFLHVVIGEMVPKNISLARPDSAALVLGPPLALLVKVLYPVIWVLNGITTVVLKAFRVEPKNEVTSAFTRDEVANLVTESRGGGHLDINEERLLLGALTFEERDVSAVVLPVSALTTLPDDVTVEEAENTAASGFSRFPITDRSGRLTGYVHAKDLLETDPVVRCRRIAPELIRALPTVRTTDGLRPVLEMMRNTGAHFAAATDQHQQVVGVIALEDLLEELVGQIRNDPHRR